MRIGLTWVLWLVMLFFAGCNGSAPLSDEYVGSPQAKEYALQESPQQTAVPGSTIGGRGGAAGNHATAAPILAADAVESPSSPAATSASIQRLIIYNAGLRIIVPDILAAQRAIQQQAASAGGYMQELDGNTITIRIPAAKFEETQTGIERLGEVTSRRIKANDVTEEMRDLRIRLENAELTRKRLTDLIARADKIEDTIKLEQELERVTQTIELIKGKLLYMQDQIAFSTIRVELNSVRPQGPGGGVIALPFAWVKELGDGAVAGVSAAAPDTDRMWKRNERFVLPPGFVRYFERDGVTEAMSADQVIIKLRRQDNYQGGDLGFWSKLARRVIVDNRAIAMEKESDTKIKDGSAGHVLIGIKDQGARKQAYMLGIVATQRYVYTFEAWGEKEKMDPQIAALEAAFQSLDVKHW